VKTSIRLGIACAVIAALAITGTAGASKLITGGSIKNGSIGTVDLSKSARKALTGKQGPAGRSGPQGPAGPAGPTGPTGAAGVAGIQVVDGPRVALCADNGFYLSCQVNTSIATCPPGLVATGGNGFSAGLSYAGGIAGPTSYSVIAGNLTSLTDVFVQAQVYCASAAGATVASVHAESAAKQRVAALVAQERAVIRAH